MSKREPVIALVVAVADNGAIGRGGDLPWRLSSDLKQFRKLTLGKPVIMGRRTFESLGRVLDQRVNIVLTRDPEFDERGVVVARSFEDALTVARDAAARAGVDEIMVIGGEDVFRAALPLAGRIYLTEVHAKPEADTWFPEFDASVWREILREAHEPAAKDDYPFSFVVLERH
ncbi:MAG: dihydrofolate reductase [Methyloceanibacter sp.]